MHRSPLSGILTTLVLLPCRAVVSDKYRMEDLKRGWLHLLQLVQNKWNIMGTFGTGSNELSEAAFCPHIVLLSFRCRFDWRRPPDL